MKSTYKYLTIAVAAVGLTGCADLDTEIMSNIVSSSQKEEILQMDPDMALAGVTGCFSGFLTSGFDSSSDHYDYGYSSLMLMMDCASADMASKNIGYNWYSSMAAYSGLTATNAMSGSAWSWMYNQIGTCNNLLASIPSETDNETFAFYRAQGMALRAFDYWVLAQLYAFNYTVNPEAPCVPVITELNKEEALAEGLELSTVAQVYDQILSDINGAIEILEQSSITPSKVISSKPKRIISLATAYGIQARAYLSMHKYAEAAEAASKAIANFSGAPYSKDDVSKPTFINIEDKSWMWGIPVAETDRVSTSGIVNFPSHMGSFCYGYCTVGTWRWCSYKLYSQIPTTDVRKGWFLDENGESVNLNEAQQEYLADFGFTTNPDNQGSSIEAFTQVKYAPYNNELGNGTNASDIPLMRIEEMYYIYAEATGLSKGVSAGKEALEQFVKSYRNSKYVCEATSDAEFENECWLQRRIEFWGEGMSYFDMMRLNRGLDRTNDNFPSQFTYLLEPGDSRFVFCIPLSEVQNNKKLDSSVNDNRGGVRPTPIVDSEEE